MNIVGKYGSIKEIPNVKEILNCVRELTLDDVDNACDGIGIDHENRFDIFLLIKKKLRGELYWYALRNAYDSTDNLFRHKYEVRKAFNRRELGRSKLMSEEEIEYLDTLPETLTIYRGMTEEELKSGVHGVSWTLKKETAEFFRGTYGRNYATNHLKKVVHVLIIKKSKVIAFINGRNEFEIIYLHPKPRSM